MCQIYCTFVTARGGAAGSVTSRSAGNQAQKLASRTGLADDHELGIMAADNVLDDGQPKADAAVLPGAATVDAEEALRQSRQVFLGYSFTRVAYAELRAICIGPPGQRDLPVIRRVPDGIRQQVAYQ